MRSRRSSATARRAVPGWPRSASPVAIPGTRAGTTPSPSPPPGMDTQRLILFVVFSFSLLLLWEAWQKETRPPPPPATATQGAVPTPSAQTGAPPVKGAAVPPAAATSAEPRDHVRVKTDTLLAHIDTLGGDID